MPSTLEQKEDKKKGVRTEGGNWARRSVCAQGNWTILAVLGLSTGNLDPYTISHHPQSPYTLGLPSSSLSKVDSGLKRTSFTLKGK